MADVQSGATTNEYRVRPYRPADRDRFLALYETVWEHEKGREWFEWRFEDAPYSRDVRMAVVESDGGLVGAEPLLPTRLRVGDRKLSACQPVDWIVHPDHRRRGLFTRMTERVLEDFVDDVDLLYNFPNDALLPGLQKFDWREVGPATTCYRVNDAGRLAETRHWNADAPAAAALAKLGAPLFRRGLDVLDRVGSPPETVSVERVDGVPVETVRTLYEETRPDRAHVPRDRTFLEWRFANPRWDVTTYVARRDGEPVASAIVARESVEDARLVQVLDVQPMVERESRSGGVRAILDRIVGDVAEAELLKVSADCCSPGILRRYGFWPDDEFPLSRVAASTTHVVRPVRDDGAPLQVEGFDLADPESWVLALADRDVG